MQYGADFALKTEQLDFKKEIDTITNGKVVDLVINSVGGATIPLSMEALKKKGGRLVLIGSAAGRNVEIDIFQLLIREMQLIGCNFGSLPPEERGVIYEVVKKILEEEKLKIVNIVATRANRLSIMDIVSRRSGIPIDFLGLVFGKTLTLLLCDRSNYLVRKSDLFVFKPRYHLYLS